MLRVTLLTTTVIIIVVISIAYLFVYIKNCLTNTFFEQIDNIEEYILEKTNDMVEKAEELEVLDKFTSIKDYLNKIKLT